MSSVVPSPAPTPLRDSPPRTEVTPERPAKQRRWRLLGPIAIAAAMITIVLIAQVVFDPFRQHIPLCMFKALTGLDCPGCGAIRSVHALLSGDLLLALRNNALVTMGVPVAITMFTIWLVSTIRGKPVRLLPPIWLVVTLIVVAIAFGVLRNFPAFWFLAPVSYVAP